MSRAWQVERQADLEQEALDRRLESGELSSAEYNAAVGDLQRDVRGAYEEDCLDAIDRVRDEWGY